VQHCNFHQLKWLGWWCDVWNIDRHSVVQGCPWQILRPCLAMIHPEFNCDGRN
jgi:hypothetical protein